MDDDSDTGVSCFSPLWHPMYMLEPVLDLMSFAADSSLLAVSDSRLDKSILWIDVNHMYHYAPVSTLSCSIPSPFVQHTSPSSKMITEPDLMLIITPFQRQDPSTDQPHG